MPVWDPEVEVDVSRARALIGEQFPELADRPMRELASGWDNVVHLVDERWVFRFPRRRIAVAGVQREIEVLARLAPNLPLPVPVPRFVGAPSGAYPWPWFGTPYLEGAELAEAGLADAEREEIATSMGAFLRALHDPALASRVAAGLPVDPMRRADMPFRVAVARRQLDELVAAGLWRRDPAVDELLAEAAGLPPPSRVVVLHGDLHARHVLVAPDGAGVAGVIDWGDVCTGDPSVDLSFAYAAFEGAARAAFIARYGPIDRLAELRARVIAAFVAAALLAYAEDRRMPALRADSLRSLERAVA